MKRLSIIFGLSVLVVALAIVAQDVQYGQFLKFTSVASGPVDFVTNQGNARFYWNWRDLSNGVTVSNQWLDRVQSAHLWQMNTTLSPTNSFVNGVRFQGAQQLTNIAISEGVGVSVIGTTFLVFTFEPAFSAIQTTADGTAQGVYIDGSNRLRYNGGSLGVTVSSALPTLTNIDVIITYNNGTITFYTNGALSVVNTTAGTAAAATSVGHDGASGDRLTGWFLVRAYYSNILSTASISNLHYWRTNASLSGIGGSP